MFSPAAHQDLLSDEEWEILAPFFVPTGRRRGRPPEDPRRVLAAILWVIGSDERWRHLPDVFGNFSSIHKQFRRWSEAGLWRQLLEHLEARRAALGDPWPIRPSVGRRKESRLLATLRRKIASIQASAALD
jgi:transposase